MGITMQNRFHYILKLPKIFLLIAALLSNGFIANAQQVNVHLNKQVFIGGSLLKYAVYLSEPINKKNKLALGTIVYFDISDINNQSVTNWKIQVNGNKADGAFIIPDNLLNGLYFLHVYTNSSRAEALKSTYSTPILIQEIQLEPMQQISLVKNTSEATHTDSNNALFVNNNLLKVTVEQDTSSVPYTGSTKLCVSLAKESITAQMSVSITEISPFSDMLAQVSLEASKYKELVSNQDYLNFDVEQGFTILSGKVFGKNGAPCSNQPVYISFTGQSVSFRYSITDEKGNFCFALDTNWNNKELLLQLGFNTPGFDSVVWEIDQKRPQLGSFDTVGYTLKTNEYEYLLQLQKRELVNRIFTPKTNVELQPNRNLTIDNFFLNPTYVIYPADFESLNDFKEIADNILPAVRFKKEGDSYKMGIITEQQQVVFENVLVCLNGNPVMDMNTVAHFSSAEIERVEIFSSELLYGHLTYMGVVSIFTRNKNFSLKEVSPFGYYYGNNFYADAFQPASNNPNSPVVEPDVYWNPNVNLAQNESFSFKVAPVDIGEKYLLTIYGNTKTGESILYQQPIHLGKNNQPME